MSRHFPNVLLTSLLLLGCKAEPTEAAKPAKAEDANKAGAAKAEAPAEPAPAEPATAELTPEPQPAEPAKPEVSAGDCDEGQVAISKAADERAAPYNILAHLDKNFADMKISWLMKDSAYQKYVVDTNAEKFGRCNETACYLFAAPTAVIEAAVDAALVTEGGHDPAKLGEALGLPAANMEGPLRMFTIDLATTKTCVRLPVDEDPGVWKCQSEDDKDCFKFGGYTSGGVPELMAINVPVAAATIREIQ